MVWSLSRHPLSLAQCLEPSPLPGGLRIGSGPQVPCLGHGSRRRLSHRWCVSQSGEPFPLGPGSPVCVCRTSQVLANGEEEWSLRSLVLKPSPLNPHCHPLPPGAAGPSGQATTQQGPSRAPLQPWVLPHPPSGGVLWRGPWTPLGAWLWGGHRKTGCVASLPGSHGPNNGLRVDSKSLPLLLSIPSPRVTINVTASPMDDYDGAMSGRLGRAPQLAATAFTKPAAGGRMTRAEALPLRTGHRPAVCCPT